MNRILSFWTSLQDRERAIMKILAIAILIGLASLFYTNILGSINKNKNILNMDSTKEWTTARDRKQQEIFNYFQSLIQ